MPQQADATGLVHGGTAAAGLDQAVLVWPAGAPPHRYVTALTAMRIVALNFAAVRKIIEVNCALVLDDAMTPGGSGGNPV